jgi:hypothetical protein
MDKNAINFPFSRPFGQDSDFLIINIWPVARNGTGFSNLMAQNAIACPEQPFS